jgi:RNA polymerase sigma-70 factor, ECF subfamily
VSERYVEDLVLIQRAQGGDRSAFNDLIRKHEARAYQFAYRLTRNADEASDVVAEAFVRIYNALHNFRGQSAFTTWMYRILTNCFLDVRKKDRGARACVSLEASLQSETGTFERQIEGILGNPYDETERTERERSVQAALLKLPEYQRAMIVMYHAELLSYEEISEALDLPIGTVKSRLNRARLNLRNFLTKNEELFKI